MKLTSDTKRSQLVRFCINGCAAVAIQYAVYSVLLCAGCEANVALTVGYVVSFACNFIGTCYWTFRSKPSWKLLTGFGGSHVVNYFVQLAFLNLYLWMKVPESLSGILAMASAVPINFILLRYIFTKK